MATEWLTYDDFADRIGERFTTPLAEGGELALELIEATQSSEPGGPGPGGAQRLQFSLLFRGPADQLLPQATVALTHSDLGELLLFLVPIGPDASGMRYEAAFA